MFNPEQLLNKVISEMAGSSVQKAHGKKSKKKKNKKKRKAKGLSDTLVSNLSSGKGLMTALALGVGAYEVIKSNNKSAVPVGGSAPAPPLPAGNPPSAPPPLPGNTQTVPPAPAAGDFGKDETIRTIAVRLIQVMIAAAWADGSMDAEEEAQILSKLQDQGLDKEEKMFLFNELHEPKSIAQLTEDVQDPRMAQTMYSLAVATLVIDTDAERQWLDELAAALSITPEMQAFIEEEL